MDEKFLDNIVMEAGDMVEGAIQGCALFGKQDMDMRMEVGVISESLDHRHHSRLETLSKNFTSARTAERQRISILLQLHPFQQQHPLLTQQPHILA